MECPKCDAEIGRANYCGCGWKNKKPDAKEPELLVECCRQGCPNRAKVKILVDAGWDNLCLDHYDQHWKREPQPIHKRGNWTELQARLAKHFTS